MNKNAILIASAVAALGALIVIGRIAEKRIDKSAQDCAEQLMSKVRADRATRAKKLNPDEVEIVN